jgi:hypothetical protein
LSVIQNAKQASKIKEEEESNTQNINQVSYPATFFTMRSNCCINRGLDVTGDIVLIFVHNANL